MGRRCCCSDDCVIVSDKLLVRDLDEIFNVTGNFSVDCGEDFNETNEAYYYYDILTFTGDFSLDLKYPKAIYSNDNFAMNFVGEVDNLSSGDTVTETLTFTIGQNTLEVKSIRNNDMYNQNYSFTVKHNNDVVFLITDKDSGFGHVFYNSSPLIPIISATHYIIRKDGQLYYYIAGFGLEILLLCKVSDTPTDNLSFTYSWESDASNPTITFLPNNLRIWKPDKWWKYSKYKTVPKKKLSNLTSADIEAIYSVYTDNEIESEGCESPESHAGASLLQDTLISNEDIAFSELSPNIAIRFGGCKSSKTFISAVPITAIRYESGYDEHGEYYYREINELETIYSKIATEKTNREQDPTYQDPYEDPNDSYNYGTINGLDTDIIDLDGIMTSQAAVWDGANYEYKLEWYNGTSVAMKYDTVSAQILNGVTGGNKVTFQQMIPVTVMYNKEWYSTDFVDEWNNPYHGGFSNADGYIPQAGGEGLHWCCDANAIYSIYGRVSRHVGGHRNYCCRRDPFAYFYGLENPTYSYDSTATDVFAITDTTLQFRKGIIAPDIDVELTPSIPGKIDFIFNKPNTSSFSIYEWRISHIVNVSDNQVLHYGASYGTTTTVWYAEDNNNPQNLSQRDRTSPVGGYFKLEYTTAGYISAAEDHLIYVLEDQFGAKSVGHITVHFTQDALNDVTVTVAPDANAEITTCSDYDTLCEVKCTVPFGITYSNNRPYSVGAKDIYLHYVHDGKTCTVEDLIKPTPLKAEMKIPSPWVSIDGVLQDSVYVEFVAPIHTDCSLAHDYNFGLENSLLNSGEVDNVEYLKAYIQLWNYSDQDNPVVYGNEFYCTLNPRDSVGCPFNSNNKISHNGNVSTVYEGSFAYSATINGIARSGTIDISVGSSYARALPYRLGEYMGDYVNQHIVSIYGTSLGYSVSKITVIYTSGKEVDINTSAINLADYPALVLGDLYND